MPLSADIWFMRAYQFHRNRKFIRSHQNVLVFFKGDPKRIGENFGEVEVGAAGSGEALAEG